MKTLKKFEIKRTAVEKIGIITDEEPGYMLEFFVDTNMVIDLLEKIRRGLLNRDSTIHILLDKGERHVLTTYYELYIKKNELQFVIEKYPIRNIIMSQEEVIKKIVDCFKESAMGWASDYAFRGVSIIYGKMPVNEIVMFQNRYEKTFKKINDLCDKIDRMLIFLKDNKDIRVSTIVFEEKSLNFENFFKIEPDTEITVNIENHKVSVFPFPKGNGYSKGKYLVTLKGYQCFHTGLIKELQKIGVDQKTEFTCLKSSYYRKSQLEELLVMDLPKEELVCFLKNDNRITKNDLKSITIALEMDYHIEEIINEFLLNADNSISK